MNSLGEIFRNGIFSICSANELVIEASMENAASTDSYVLIEATANQVNQFGGYTGMTPADFRAYVYSLADKVGFDKAKVILGGDHLGPLTWAAEEEGPAMAKAETLVRDFVLAGFSKIHIDTSMRLLGDDPHARLSDETIARRGAALCKAAENARAKLQEQDGNAISPVYVIGSEVPVPGGAREAEVVSVTSPEDFKATVNAFESAFANCGLTDAWGRVVAVVVQPGVEFSDSEVVEYDREKASALTSALTDYPGMIFEGHSTDYQTKHNLARMVEDGVRILKVGPALTFAMREALFALSAIEGEVVPAAKRAYFVETLMETMYGDPSNWVKYYHGTHSEIGIKLKYSYSDRERYYLGCPPVTVAINKLISNIDGAKPEANILSQHLPIQYDKIRMGFLKNDACSLIKDRIRNCLDTYNYAVKRS